MVLRVFAFWSMVLTLVSGCAVQRAGLPPRLPPVMRRSCDDVQPLASAFWSGARARVLAETSKLLKPPAQLAAELLRQLDLFAREWDEREQVLCQQALSHKTLSARAYEQATMCRQPLLLAFSAMTDQLKNLDKSKLMQAHELAVTLNVDVLDCEKPGVYREYDEQASDDDAREGRAELAMASVYRWFDDARAQASLRRATQLVGNTNARGPALVQLLEAAFQAREENQREQRRALVQQLLMRAEQPTFVLTRVAASSLLAQQLRQDGDRRGAESLLLQVLEVRTRELGAESYYLLDTHRSLGAIALERGDLDAAESHARAALELASKHLGELQPVTAWSLHALASVLEVRNDSAGALQALQRGLRILQGSLGEKEPGRALFYSTMGSLHERLGDQTQAHAMHQRAMAAIGGELGRADAETAVVFLATGRFWLQQQEYVHALQLLLRAQTLIRSKLGERNPLRAECAMLIARAYAHFGDGSRALALAKDALSAQLEAYGELHWRSAAWYLHMGAIHRKFNDFDAALRAFRKAREIERALATPESKDGPSDHIRALCTHAGYAPACEGSDAVPEVPSPPIGPNQHT